MGNYTEQQKQNAEITCKYLISLKIFMFLVHGTFIKNIMISSTYAISKQFPLDLVSTFLTESVITNRVIINPVTIFT